MKFRAIAASISLCAILASCGSGGGGSTPTPSPTPAPSPTPTPTPSPTPTPTPTPASFFQGVTHFDNFDRADTTPGAVSAGPQSQTYEVFSNFLNAADAFSQVKGKRYYMAPTTANAARASYAMVQATGQVKRLGAVLEYAANTEVATGPNGYVWTLILSDTRNRFTDHMIHFTGSHIDWKVEIWYPTGTRRTLVSGTFNPRLDFTRKNVVDLKLAGNTATVTMPNETKAVTDPDIGAFAGARYLVLEHFVNGPSVNINRYPAWYYEVQGASLANPALFAGFEP